MSVKLAQMLAEQTNNGQDVVDFVVGVLSGRTTEKPVGKAKVGKVKVWSDKYRVWAAEWIGDRYWGKAKQVVEFESATTQPQANYEALDSKDLAELDRIMTKALDSRPDEPSEALQLPGAVIPIESGSE